MAKSKSEAKGNTPAAEQPPVGRRVAGQADVWKPIKRGEKLEGAYTSHFTYKNSISGKDSKGYRIMTAGGAKIVFGTGVLDSRMIEVPEGSKVWITYLGKVNPPKGSRFPDQQQHDWQVEYEVIPF